MITPISRLAENTACLTKFSHILGNTIDYGQNTDGDWTKMNTIKWPIIMIPIIILLWALPNGYLFLFIYPKEGYNIPNIKLEIF